jgi:formylglycine-generating enzyme required for sulfatase activity
VIDDHVSPNYYLAKTPVTNAQYRAFVLATGSETPSGWTNRTPPRGKDDHPVVDVSWDDALSYCRWLAEVTGRDYTLPSEAEWEKAARGSNGRIYPWGHDLDPSRANHFDSLFNITSAVGGFPSGDSPYGVQELSGNVWEWTRSLWGEDWREPTFKYPYNSIDGRECLDAPKSILRVLRGGAFLHSGRLMRCAARNWIPHHRDWNIGFRVVMHP